MKRGIVNVCYKEIRELPFIESTLIDDILFGWEIEILEDYGEWVKIRTDYNYEGYVTKVGITRDYPMIDFWDKKEKEVVLNRYVDILSMPKVQSKVILNLTIGSLVAKYNAEDINGWSLIITPMGEKGYIRNKFINKINENFNNDEEIRNELVSNAKRYLGTQYRWGGKTGIGIDCSGLMFMAYRLIGIKIYRDAQIKEGFNIKEIEYKNIKKGDLIFFKNHVGMYIGNDEIIHSSEYEDGVVVSSLNSKDYNYVERLAKGIVKVGSIF